MTVPTTNIGMSHIQTEFGGANPVSMSEYYAGGTYVPTGQTNNVPTAVPTSGTISINNFKGATKLSLNAVVNNSSLFDFSIVPTAAFAGIRFHSDGTVDVREGNGGYVNSYTWRTGTGASSDYEVRWTVGSGTPTGDTTGTWLGLGTTREWYEATTGGGFSSQISSGTVEIRMAASPFTVFDSGSINLDASTEI